MIIFGSRASRIGNVDLYGTSCDHCSQSDTQEITAFGRYAHVFWIPMFPLGKVVVSECSHCMKTIPKRNFSPSLRRKYEEQKQKVKTPIWHWSGLIFIVLMIFISAITASFTEHDPREALLQKDIYSMQKNPREDLDSLSYRLKIVIDDYVVEELNPNSFSYLVKIKEDKALVLVKIPKLRKIEKQARPEIIDLIEMALEPEKRLKNKQLYIGILGRYSVKLLRTPSSRNNGSFILDTPLYEFYDSTRTDSTEPIPSIETEDN